MEKVLQKALKKLGIEEDKFARAQELIELLKEEEADTTPEDEETSEVEPAQEEPKKVEAEATTPPKQVDYDDIRTQLGLEKFESVIVEQDKAIKELREELKKTRSAGYSPSQQDTKSNETVEDIFNQIQKVKFK